MLADFAPPTIDCFIIGFFVCGSASTRYSGTVTAVLPRGTAHAHTGIQTVDILYVCTGECSRGARSLQTTTALDAYVPCCCRYDDGDSELAVPVVPELVIPHDEQSGEGVQGLLRLNHTVGDMCHKLQLLQCASQLLVRQDAHPVHVPGQHQALQGVSFFPVNTVAQRLPNNAEITRFLCGNATGVLATVDDDKANLPPSSSSPAPNSTAGDEWKNGTSTPPDGSSSLFHQHLSDSFDLLGTYAAGYVCAFVRLCVASPERLSCCWTCHCVRARHLYQLCLFQAHFLPVPIMRRYVQMAHVPPPYLQPCSAGEKVTAIWAPYSVPLPAVIQTVNRGNLFMHSPVHKWGHAGAGGVYVKDCVSCIACEHLFPAHSLVRLS